ncbi:hypothetical protein ACWEOR_31155, partial [Micromonospora chalcea]
QAAMQRYVARYQAYLESEADLDPAWVRGTTYPPTRAAHLTDRTATGWYGPVRVLLRRPSGSGASRGEGDRWTSIWVASNWWWWARRSAH